MPRRLPMISVGFNDLAYERAFDYIPSQDPDVSMRVSLPVGNWLGADGTPQKKFAHPDIVWNEKKQEYRFRFYNGKDGDREQQVRIDGTGVIMIGGVRPHQLNELTRHIILTTRGPDFLNGSDLVQIMGWVRNSFHIYDFYNSSKEDVEDRFWFHSRPRENITYGGVIPKPHVSCAIGYKGPVTFNILASGAQVHAAGGFVTFPTFSAEAVKAAGREGIAALCEARSVTPRAVEMGVFRGQNTLKDHKPIPEPDFRPRQRRKKLALGG